MAEAELGHYHYHQKMSIMYLLLNLFCIGTALVAAVTHSKSINISDECRITFMRCILTNMNHII